MGKGHQSMVVILSFFTLSFSFGCQKDTEHDRIAKAVAAVQHGVEQKDVKGILAHISKTYRDPQGNDYEGIKGLLLLYFLRHQRISTVLTDLEITIKNPSAEARFQSILSGRSGETGGILPEALGAYRFEVIFMKESSDWKIISARWEQFGDGSP